MHEMQPFHIMVKPRGPICNLACRYCYYRQKKTLYAGSDFRMTRDVLESYIRQTIEIHPGPEVTFSWQGGEPTLMGLSFFEVAIRLQKEYAQPGKQILNALQTNGTTLNPEWCRFFKTHQFLIGLSMDGPPSLHNTYRKTTSGRDRFDSVLRAARLLKHHQVNFNVLCCVHQANVKHPLKVYRYLRDKIGANFIQFIPILQRELDHQGHETQTLTSLSVDGAMYGEFLKSVFDEWVQKDVGRIFVQLFDVALGVWIGQSASLCVFAETCGHALAMEHNGDLYACDHFVTPEHLLGNITKAPIGDLIASARQVKFGQAKLTTLPQTCLQCDVRFICNGGCPKNRETNGLNHLCKGYQAFFRYIDRPMRMMGELLKNNRSPAEIMQRYQPDVLATSIK